MADALTGARGIVTPQSLLPILKEQAARIQALRDKGEVDPVQHTTEEEWAAMRAAADAAKVRLESYRAEQSKPVVKAPGPADAPQDEITQGALGQAAAARRNVETLSYGVGIYNSGLRTLGDAARQEKLRRTYGNDAYEGYVGAMKRSMNAGLEMMNSALGDAAQFYNASPVVSRTETGEFKISPYIQTASGNGWSVSVDSTGRAKVTANGVDVSGYVDDSSSWGFRWSEVIARTSVVA